MSTYVKEVGATRSQYRTGDVLELGDVMAVVLDVSRTEYRLVKIGKTSGKGESFKVPKGVVEKDWKDYFASPEAKVEKKTKVKKEETEEVE